MGVRSNNCNNNGSLPRNDVTKCPFNPFGTLYHLQLIPLLIRITCGLAI